MGKTKAASVTGERVKSYIERVEKLLEERAAIQSDIRDVFSEAKGVGYDVKTLRKLIGLRAMDAADRDEAQALLDTYAHAIGMDLGQTIAEPSEEELIERASRIVGEVDRCMALVEGGKPPKIEAIKDLIGCSAGKAHKLRGMVDQRIKNGFSRSIAADRENENPTIGHAPPPENKAAAPMPVAQTQNEHSLTKGEADGLTEDALRRDGTDASAYVGCGEGGGGGREAGELRHGRSRETEGEGRATCDAYPVARESEEPEVAPGPQDPPKPDGWRSGSTADDDLAIPPFLKRQPQAVG